jgi:hypothetical protein
MVVKGTFAAAVRKTYSLRQNYCVLTAATSTVVSIWNLAPLATMMVVYVAMAVESSELWKVAVALREREMVARAAVAVSWLFLSLRSA